MSGLDSASFVRAIAVGWVESGAKSHRQFGAHSRRLLPIGLPPGRSRATRVGPDRRWNKRMWGQAYDPATRLPLRVLRVSRFDLPADDGPGARSVVLASTDGMLRISNNVIEPQNTRNTPI